VYKKNNVGAASLGRKPLPHILYGANLVFGHQTRVWSSIILLIVIVMLPDVALAQDKKGEQEGTSAENSLVFPVLLYKKYASGADGARCPMVPSCSSYAVDAVYKHGFIMGWIMTCDRLMRCGRDEVRRTKPVRINEKILRQDPVENNDFWWK